MGNLINYGDFLGSVEYSAEDRVFFGKIEFINDLVTFEAINVDDLEYEFRRAVDHYIDTCKKLGRPAQKAFKGQFNVRITSDLHRKAAIIARKRNVSLNKLVETAIAHEIEA
jgi:predicted HicB family RNase H-like nuclease